MPHPLTAARDALALLLGAPDLLSADPTTMREALRCTALALASLGVFTVPAELSHAEPVEVLRVALEQLDRHYRTHPSAATPEGEQLAAALAPALALLDLLGGLYDLIPPASLGGEFAPENPTAAYFLGLAAATLTRAQVEQQAAPQLAAVLSARAQLALALDVLSMTPAKLAPQVLTRHAARDLMTAALLTRRAATVAEGDQVQALDRTAAQLDALAQQLDPLAAS